MQGRELPRTGRVILGLMLILSVLITVQPAAAGFVARGGLDTGNVVFLPENGSPQGLALCGEAPWGIPALAGTIRDGARATGCEPAQP